MTSYQGGPAVAAKSIRIDLATTTVLPRYSGLGQQFNTLNSPLCSILCLQRLFSQLYGITAPVVNTLRWYYMYAVDAYLQELWVC